ncbi:hypothetical protein CVT25_004012 [Psilocybe cyanescens]|uniref:STEEP1 domain-containing protein n=1 Tax=Psilocybe cyanescens TaxID=93625 RepID=A0A409WXM8_PSICY|nr:hypothetical protein CVT25_004012 [Psilocybe cyanescens]
MPKVVSRSAVSSSTDAQPTASSAASLRVYYCICGEFILVIDKSLATLPRRKTDNAIIIRSKDSDDGKARVFKLNAVAEDPILLERYPSNSSSQKVKDFADMTVLIRSGGHEKQYRFHCPRCSLKIGYQSTPPPVKAAPFIYIFSGALTQMQGQVPPDAFDGENDL